MAEPETEFAWRASLEKEILARGWVDRHSKAAEAWEALQQALEAPPSPEMPPLEELWALLSVGEKGWLVEQLEGWMCAGRLQQQQRPLSATALSHAFAAAAQLLRQVASTTEHPNSAQPGGAPPGKPRGDASIPAACMNSLTNSPH